MLLCASLFMAGLACTMLAVSGPITSAADQKAAVGNHWQHHDGHWNYWDDGDQQWYYTDGTNWFYNDGNAWAVYGFDKQFGKEGFDKGEYKAPASGVKVATPQHALSARAPKK
jgi:hypothetical protein